MREHHQAHAAGCRGARLLAGVRRAERLLLGIAALAGGALTHTAARAADAPWQQTQADLRFECEVTDSPSDPKAGILAILPDGGVMPRNADVVVVDSGGKPLRREIVWRNPHEGLGVVFETQPTGTRVFAYVGVGIGAASRNLPPSAAFKSGLFLYTRMMVEPTLEAAAKLGTGTPPGEDGVMGMVPRIGQMENPWGNDANYASYYTGWLKLDKGGRTYIATISEQGSECRIDSKIVANWPGLHNRNDGRRGQYGSWVDLTPGFHKIEYTQFETTGIPEANACWRPPGSGESLPVTIPASAYVHSGAARVVSAAYRDGRPVAALGVDVRSYLWLKDRPVTLCNLYAQCTGTHPADTRYLWSLPGGLQAEGREVLWPFEGDFPQDVSLTVLAGKTPSKTTRAVCPGTTPRKGSLNSPVERKAYRDALLARCRGVAEPKRPCQGWDADLWATLLAVVEPFKAKALLLEVFNRSRADVLALDTTSRWQLEDAFFDVVRYAETSNTVTWLNRLEQEEKDGARRFEWKLARIDFHLYDLNDLKTARTLVSQARQAALLPEDVVRALVRAGDVERMAENFDEARKLYSAAQDRWLELSKNQSVVSAVSITAPPRKERGAPKEPVPQPPMRRVVDDNWKKAAVREASFYATFQNQLRQGALVEAKATLREWEIELPMSKLTGDYPLAEAEYYVAVGLYERALRIVRAYRKGLDISSYLPRAMSLELDCLQNLNRTDEMKELARDIIKRFPSHPAAEKAQSVLQ